MKRARRLEKWDNYAIKAEIRRRGYSLTSLAVENGFAPSTLRAAFLRPHSGANRVIAQCVQKPLHVLWPHWFDAHGDLIPARRRHSNIKSRNSDSRELVAA
jgi:Ner family transcriptional regulator